MKKVILLSSKKASPYGEELVVNGGFDTDTDWTIYNPLQSDISGGKFNVTDTTSSLNFLKQDLNVLEEGKTYLVTMNVNRDVSTSGVIQIQLRGIGGSFFADGLLEQTIIAGSSTTGVFIKRGGTDWQGTIDNISIREIL